MDSLYILSFSILLALSIQLYRNILRIKNEIKKEKEKSKLANDEIIKISNELIKERKKEKEIIFWIINKPSEKDYLTLEKSTEALSLFIKILHYEIAKTTDIARASLENEVIQRNIWALNKLHELNLLFDKIKNYSKKNDDEE